MKIKDLLPIGSVVRLHDGEKRLMIIGIMQSDASGNGKEYPWFFCPLLFTSVLI